MSMTIITPSKTSSLLTPRWTPLLPHPEQIRYINSTARFKTVPAGRRSGKTERAKRKVIIKALRGTDFPNARFFAGAPTRPQAKQIFWEDLKALSPREFVKGKPNETDLIIKYKNGSETHVVSLDRPERIEGQPWDGGVVDEIANCKADAWKLNIRPALSDRRGWCDLIGVPEGRNHYYELDQYAKNDDTGEWDSFHWKSADILPLDEIEAAKRDLDELSYLQEYEASFINFAGRAYYPFESLTHCAPLEYNNKEDLIITFDFNVAPGTAAILQEMKLPNGLEGTGVLSEIYIPRNSNTPAVCKKIINDWGKHEGRICCYGDATGGARGTAKVDGSDWVIINNMLSQHYGYDRVYFFVPEANPAERSRINSVNSRLKSTSGDIRLMVDNRYAPNVVKDFEGVSTLEGGSGEIDKKKDPKLTHLSDGIGYYIWFEYPVNAHNAKLKVIGN